MKYLVLKNWKISTINEVYCMCARCNVKNWHFSHSSVYSVLLPILLDLFFSILVYIHSVIDEVVLCTSINGILTFYKKRATQNYPKNYGHEFSSIFFIMNIAVACTLTYLGTSTCYIPTYKHLWQFLTTSLRGHQNLYCNFCGQKVYYHHLLQNFII